MLMSKLRPDGVLLYHISNRYLDLEPVLAYARSLLAERPRSGGELRATMAERFPDHDAAALAYACRNRLAVNLNHEPAQQHDLVAGHTQT